MSKILFFFLIILFFTYKPCNAQNLDLDLLTNINPNGPRKLDNTFHLISNSLVPFSLTAPIGSGIVYLLDKSDKNKLAFFQFSGAILGNAIVTYSLKKVIDRNRPYIDYPNLIFPKSIERSSSMPSGHSSAAFALATSISINYPKWQVIVPAYVWASSVAYSRLYLGVHYPSDVLIGASIGSLSAIATHYLNKKLFQRKKSTY